MNMKKKTETICVRFTQEDMKSIDKLAKKMGMWPGSWIRCVVLEHLQKTGNKKKTPTHIREYVR